MLAAGAPFLAARRGGGGTPCAQVPRLQEFDYFVVVDFEATCEKDARIYPQEIIEFPSVLVDGATGRLASAFRMYIRPQHHPVLTDYCRDLTGIRQADVDVGVELSQALRLHDAWLEAAAGAKKGGRFAVVTSEDWDCHTMLESECRFKGVAKPPTSTGGSTSRTPSRRRSASAAEGSGSSCRRLSGRRGWSGRAAPTVGSTTRARRRGFL